MTQPRIVAGRIRKYKRQLETQPRIAVRSAVKNMERDAKATLMMENRVASFALYNSLHSHVRIVGKRTIGTVEASVPYAGYVEFGTGTKNVAVNPAFRYNSPDLSPGLIRAIRGWMIVKPTFTLPPTMQRAYFISKRISETGTPATLYMTKAVQFYKPIYSQQIRNAVRY